MTNFVSLKEYVLNEVVWNYTLAPIPQRIADWGSSCLSTTSALASPVKLIPSSLLMLLNWRTADFCSEFPFHAWYSIMTHCLKRSMKVSLNFWSRLTSFQWHKRPQTEIYRTPDTIYWHGYCSWGYIFCSRCPKNPFLTDHFLFWKDMDKLSSRCSCPEPRYC